MKKNNVFVKIATMGPMGNLVAPGTIGTLLTLPIAYILGFLNPANHFLVLFALLILSIYIVQKATCFFRETDPSEIILDEFIGCLITFWALPINLQTLFWGFVIFRILDISKIFGINRLENLKGGYGIVLDDVVAGMISNLILHFIL